MKLHPTTACCFDCKLDFIRFELLGTLARSVLQLIGGEAFTPDTLPGNIRGISIMLLLAVAGNSDSHIQYLLGAQLAQVKQFRTRAVSTDTVEGGFAELSIRYKATPQELEQHLRRLDLRRSIMTASS